MSETRDPSRDQNLPKGGHREVQQALIDVISDRRDLGIRKYGQPVMTHNGRSALRDAWEEVIDLAVYLTQMMLEAGEEILPVREHVEVQGSETLKAAIDRLESKERHPANGADWRSEYNTWNEWGDDN